MAITKVNGVVRNHKRAKDPRKTIRRKENKRENRENRNKTLTSKHLADRLRQVWDFESRQNRRWLVAMLEARLISGAGADVLNRWIKVKTPEERARLSIESDIKAGNDAKIQAYQDAWLALTKLKKERGEAMRRCGNGLTVDDWWQQEVSKRGEINEQDEVEGMEHAEEAGFGNENDAMLDVSEGSEGGEGGEGGEEDENDKDEGTGFQFEPPEPISLEEYAE